MIMNTVAIIADDHTGAADSAIHFARLGGNTSLFLELSALNDTLPKLNAVALTTESRFMAASQAAEQVTETVRLCKKAGIRRFFKKIDSTMRGNPGSEILAALEATDRKAALICTAMPNAGRTCVDGVILLDNEPLHTTRSGHDPFHPLTTSVVVELLAGQCDLKAGSLNLDDLHGSAQELEARVRQCMDDGCRLIIADAVDNDDLLILGKLIKDMPELLPVGAAGLAEAVARAHVSDQPCNTVSQKPLGKILAVVGSPGSRVSRTG